MTTETTNPYEAERQKRIAENLELMRSLGLEKIVEERPKLKPQRKAPSAHPKRTPKITIPKRRSTRVQGKEVAYEVLDHDPLDADFVAKPKVRFKSFSCFIAILCNGFLVQSALLQQLSRRGVGSRRSNPGRRLQGGRIYDSVLGTTCHQCRQKTVEEKVQCTNILSNGLCGLMLDERCLVGRYGQSLEDARQTGEWMCPKCRGNCNCSFCRRKSGLAPTGQLAPLARQNGFAGVSEYLEAVSKKRKSILTVDDDDDESDDDKENEWQDYPSSVAQKKLLLPKRVAVPKKVAAPKKPVERRVLPSRRVKNLETDWDRRVEVAKEMFLGVFI